MEGVFRFKSWFLNARGLNTVVLIIGILRYSWLPKATIKKMLSWNAIKMWCEIQIWRLIKPNKVGSSNISEGSHSSA